MPYDLKSVIISYLTELDFKNLNCLFRMLECASCFNQHWSLIGHWIGIVEKKNWNLPSQWQGLTYQEDSELWHHLNTRLREWAKTNPYVNFLKSINEKQHYNYNNKMQEARQKTAGGCINPKREWHLHQEWGWPIKPTIFRWETLPNQKWN